MYCSYADILLRAGVLPVQITVEGLIEDAGREIDARLSDREISGVAGDGTLRQACIELTLVRVFTRRRLDGTMVRSKTVGSVSVSDDIDAAIRQHQAKGEELLDRYIDQHVSMSTESDERADLSMPDFHLDQAEIPNYRE